MTSLDTAAPPSHAFRAADPGSVRLLPGPLLERERLNARYLLALDPNRLLHNYRLQSGLPSTAEPLGGWEAPDCGLRGHFAGHYLSACAQAFAFAGDETLCDRLAFMIDGLALCQEANGNGYLAAFPESDLAQIETTFAGAWASYYVLHKILAGLLDAYTLAGNVRALTVARGLADYICGRLARLSPEQIEGMCRTDGKPNPTNEYGGLGQSLLDLANLTGDSRYDEAARLFDRDWFIDPLIAHEDRLTGLHANTHIPLVLALARRFDLTGGPANVPNLAAYFWERTAVARSFVNGGSTGPRPDRAEKSTGGEHWPAAFELSRTLTPKNNESCVTHNMLRLTDSLFRWTGDARYADFYERGYLNHVLAMQRPGEPGGYLYDHPLAAQSVKKFGHAHDAFWCCYGSTVEAYARLAKGIFYLGRDGVRVNLYVPSELRWPEAGVTIRQESFVPSDAAARIVVRCERPTAFALSFRVPAWSIGSTVTINCDAPTPAAGPATTIRRLWQDGDTVTLLLPPRLYAEPMPDDAGVIAIRHGPLVLAARTDADLRLSSLDADAAVASLRPRGSRGHFSLTLANGRDVELVPLLEIVDEPFGVYHTLAR